MPEESTNLIPPVEEVPLPGKAEVQEASALGGERLDINVRRLGAYGALATAAVLYFAGLLVIARAHGFWPLNCDDSAPYPKPQAVQAGPPASAASPVAAPSASQSQSAAARPANGCRTPLNNDHWHTVVASLLALFSVPTILVIAVLRSVSKSSDSGTSAHAIIGEWFTTFIEKLVDLKK